MKNLIRAAALAVFLAPVAVAQADDAPVKRSPTLAKEMTPEMMKMANEKYLKASHSGNMLEIKLSQHALQELKQHEQVRELAQLLIKHHSEADAMAKEAAKQCGVELSDELSPIDQAKWNEAMKVKGEMYHVPYLFGLDSSHVMAILSTSFMLHSTNDANVKNYCAHVLPKIKMHYGKIKPLAEHEARITDGLTGGAK